MAGRNGLAAVPALREPLRVVPITETVTIDTGDGDLLHLAAYPKGAGCPISVLIDVEEAHAEWNETIPGDDERTAMKPRRYIARLNRAELILRRDILCAVIPGLTPEQAGVLATEGGPWRDVLVSLGWWDAPDAPDAEDTGDPEALPQQVTAGESESSAVQPSTATTTGPA